MMVAARLPRPLVGRVRDLVVPAVVFALPFEFTGAYLPFRLDLARLLMIAAFGVMVLDLRTRRQWFVLPRMASAAWLGLFIVEAVSSWALTRAPGAFASLAPLLAYPLLTLVVLNLVRTQADQRAVLVALLASGVVVCLVGIVLRLSGHYVVGPGTGSVGRVSSTFSDPDILARFLALIAAAGLLAAGDSFPRRWRVAALASALLAATVLPITLSRVGFVLIVLVAGAAVWLVRPRFAAYSGAVAVLAVSALIVGLQPQVRDRAANLWMLVQELGQLWTQPAPITSPQDDGPPVATIKACGLPAGWKDVQDDQAEYGWATEVPKGLRDPGPVVFGPPLTLPSGTFDVWVRVRVDDPGADVPQLRLGLWDPQTGAFLPGLFEDTAPRGFTREYRWFLLGSVHEAVAHTVQFRVLEVATTTTGWYFDRFSVTSSDRSAAVRLEEPWGPGALVAAAPITSGGFQSVADPGASTGMAADLQPGSAAGSSATFAFPQVSATGPYQIWGRMRVSSQLGARPELQASAVDASGATIASTTTVAISPSDGCASYTWQPLGAVTLSAGSTVEGRLSSSATTTADWRIDELALAPDPGAMRSTASVRPLAGTGARLASADTEPRSHFAGLLNRLPLDDQRRYLIVGGLDMFYDHPLTGVGFGAFQHNLLGTYAYDIKPGNQDSLSHNSFVTVLAEQGLIGFAILVAVIAAVVREVRRLASRARRRWIHLSVPVALLGLIVFDSLFEGRLFTEPYLWLVLGLLYSASRIAVAERVQP